MFCYVDIETTGFSQKKDAFTRFTAIKAHHYEVVDIIDILINPQRKVDPGILKMTGLSQAILDLMPPLAARAEEIRAFLRGNQLVGWGNFEHRWLTHHGLAAKVDDACAKVKRETKNKLVVADYKLPTVCKALSIPLRHHDSLSDALALYHICNLTGVLR